VQDRSTKVDTRHRKKLKLFQRDPEPDRDRIFLFKTGAGAGAEVIFGRVFLRLNVYSHSTYKSVGRKFSREEVNGKTKIKK